MFIKLTHAVSSVQGPCTGNQQSLAHSRLWDAIVGFLHVFAHMMMKLAQVRVQTQHSTTNTSAGRHRFTLTANLIQIRAPWTTCGPEGASEWSSLTLCVA